MSKMKSPQTKTQEAKRELKKILDDRLNIPGWQDSNLYEEIIEDLQDLLHQTETRVRKEVLEEVFESILSFKKAGDNYIKISEVESIIKQLEDK